MLLYYKFVRESLHPIFRVDKSTVPKNKASGTFTCKDENAQKSSKIFKSTIHYVVSRRNNFAKRWFSLCLLPVLGSQDINMIQCKAAIF